MNRRHRRRYRPRVTPDWYAPVMGTLGAVIICEVAMLFGKLVEGN